MKKAKTTTTTETKQTNNKEHIDDEKNYTHRQTHRKRTNSPTEQAEDIHEKETNMTKNEILHTERTQ